MDRPTDGVLPGDSSASQISSAVRRLGSPRVPRSSLPIHFLPGRELSHRLYLAQIQPPVNWPLSRYSLSIEPLVVILRQPSSIPPSRFLSFCPLSTSLSRGDFFHVVTGIDNWISHSLLSVAYPCRLALPAPVHALSFLALPSLSYHSLIDFPSSPPNPLRRQYWDYVIYLLCFFYHSYCFYCLLINTVYIAATCFLWTTGNTFFKHP